jgi:hypothetical protein
MSTPSQRIEVGVVVERQVEPSRAKKLNLPIYLASPWVSWAISVCAPDQAKEEAAQICVCHNVV